MGKDAKYVVRLDADEREQGPAWPDPRVAEFAEVGLSTVHRVRLRRGIFQGITPVSNGRSRERPPATLATRGLTRPWRTVGPDIPCRVAP